MPDSQQSSIIRWHDLQRHTKAVMSGRQPCHLHVFFSRMITSRSGRPVIGNLHVQGRPCKDAQGSQQQYCISIKSASALRKASFVSTAGSHPAAMTYLNFAQMPYTLHNKTDT